MYEQILDEIKKYDTIIIHRHFKPDGDAMGSQLGLKALLQTNFPEKKIYVVGDHPGYLSFMEDSQMDEISDDVYQGALAIVLDCGGPNMVCDDRYKLAARTCRMDHHLFTGQFTDVEVIDSSYESACGMVAHLAKESGLTLTPKAALAIYTGMVTDSGRFRYDNTTARTFELASYLMEQGFDTNELFHNLYADTYESKKRKAEFLLKVKFTEHNVAYIYTDYEEFLSYNTDSFTISRGMVNTMADILGVDIWANFTETENGVLCEIRSNYENINPVAVKYGGGGHAKASGATIKDRETAMAMLADLDALCVK